MKEIYQKIENNQELSRADVLQMLSVDVLSSAYYGIINYANAYARKTFENKGVIFAQIGIDAAPCSVNCKFCQLAVDNFVESNKKAMPISDVVKKAVDLVGEGAHEVFIMSTAEYNPATFLEVGREVRKAIPPHTRMVANTGDFDVAYGKELVGAGFTGVYHVCRLNEGVDTQAKLADRVKTLDAIKEAGLELYYCVEPIGPEHTKEQIADEIFRAKDYGVNVMAVMRRICFENGPMTEEITAMEMALICAVTTLCVRPNRAMGVHEPEIISLISGANQIYAEHGSNPRDVSENTETCRGFSVKEACCMLRDAQWLV